MRARRLPLLGFAIMAAGCYAPVELPVAPPTPATAAEVLDILTLNVFLRAPAWMFRDDHDQRLRAMPGALAGHDVVVLQEAFSTPHREALFAALATAYPHRTPVAGVQGWVGVDSGLVLLSRWPITDTAAIVFEDACAGVDCLADKAAIYARIDKRGRAYHLLTAHTQDGLQHRDVRDAQLRAVRALLDARGVPPHEPVIVAGDFNVDRRSDPDGYAAMLEILGAIDVAGEGEAGSAPTWDGELNPLVDGDRRERLDYVLAAREHALPVEAVVQVLQLRAASGFLSDHFAVRAHLRFAQR